MYKWFKFLSLLPIAFSVLTLSACGGASSDGESGGTGNKPDQQSSSRAQSSQQLPESSNPAVNSATGISSRASTSAESSSSAQSSQSAYARASKSSTAFSSVSNTGSGADTTPPVNTKLDIYKISTTSITLIWDDATDNVGMASYFVSRDGKKIATLKYPSYLFEDKNLAPNTVHSYSITSIDLVGNVSEESPVIYISTLPTPNSSAANSSKPSSASILSSSSRSSSLALSSSSLTPASSLSSASSIRSTTSLSSSSLNSSLKSTSSATKSSSSSRTSGSGLKTVKIAWEHPNERENGKFLELDEIAGYEIRFKKPTDTRYTYLMINGNTTNELSYTGSLDGAAFEIAVFDINGLYSQYAPVQP